MASSSAVAAPPTASPDAPLLQQRPDNHEPECHWKWYAVDVKKKAKTELLDVELEDVRRLRKDLRSGRPVPLSEKGLEARIVKLSEMQQEGAPGWWGPDAPGRPTEYFTDEEIVVQQRTEANEEGKRPWRLIVRVPADGALDQQMRVGNWTTDVLVMFSGPAALLDVGASIGNDDLPVRFTGGGFVKEDFLMHTTLYQKFSGASDSTIPHSVFEVKDGKIFKLIESDALREHFYFDDHGNVQPVNSLGFVDDFYYARIVGKAWWTSVLCKALIWALLVAVDQYNNLNFFWSTREFSAMSWPFLVAVLGFGGLEWYYCWLLACRDMEAPVHRDDMALSDTDSCMGKLFLPQTLLHFLQVPTAVKDIVIWTCPRGEAMGRAVAKVAGARVHVLTWPTKYHYECDLIQGQHKVYPLLLLKNLLLVALQVVIIVGSSSSGPPFVLPYFLPKLLILILTFIFFIRAVNQRDQLRGWLIGNWNKEQPGVDIMPEKPPEKNAKLKALYGVFLKHFYDAPQRDLWHYHWFDLDVLLPVPAHADCGQQPGKLLAAAICAIFLACALAKLQEDATIVWT